MARGVTFRYLEACSLLLMTLREKFFSLQQHQKQAKGKPWQPTMIQDASQCKMFLK